MTSPARPDQVSNLGYIEECVDAEATVEQARSKAFMALLLDYGPVADAELGNSDGRGQSRAINL